jgi:hypothetical protein
MVRNQVRGGKQIRPNTGEVSTPAVGLLHSFTRKPNLHHVMTKRFLLAGFSLAVVLLLLWTFLSPSSNHMSPGAAVTERTIPVELASLGGMPIRIIENRGQAPADVLFHASTAHHTVLFSAEAVSFGRTLDDATEQIVMRFLDSNPMPMIEGTGRTSSRTNMYLGNDPSEWLIDVPTYSSLIYRELYPGVDLTFEGRPDQLKSTFYVLPGASPSQIRFSFDGADDVSVNRDGSLVVKTPFGEWIDGAPIVYQIVEGHRAYIETRYDVSSDGTIGFRFDRYDPDLMLVIDPEIVYATYIGGSGENLIVGADVDAEGHIYVAGDVEVPDFPGVDVMTVGGAGSSFDLFVAKIDPVEGVYVWLTLFGSANTEIARGFKLDGEGNSYVTGYGRGEGFPLMNEVQSAYGGGTRDVVAAIIDSDGALQFGTYLGGSGEEQPRSIDIGPGGELVIGGSTSSVDFPTQNALQPGNAGMQDAFLSILPREGGTLAFSSYFGGSEDDVAETVWVSNDGGVWLGGQTKSADFPLLNAFDDTMTERGDGFFMRFKDVIQGGTETPELELSSFLGGNGLSRIYGITGNGKGDVCFVGSTSSDDFPTMNAFQTELGGGRDAFGFCMDGQDNQVMGSYFGLSENDVFFAMDTTPDQCMLAGGSNRGGLAYLYKFCPDGAAEEIDATGLPIVDDINVLATSLGKADDHGEKAAMSGRKGNQAIATTDKAVQPDTSATSASARDGGLVIINTRTDSAASADLSVAKLHETLPGQAPDVEHYPYDTPIKFVLTIKNNGPNASPQTVVKDVLDSPVPVTVTEAKISVKGQETPCVIAGSNVTCQAGTLAVAEIAFAEITVAGIPDPGNNIEITNTVRVSGALFDPNSINDEDAITVEFVGATTLEVTITPPKNPAVGIQTSWTVTVKNVGIRPAYGVIESVSSVTIVNGARTKFPALDQIKSRSEMGTCGPFDCTLSKLEPGAEWTIDYRGFPTKQSGEWFFAFFENILSAEARALNAPKAKADPVELEVGPGLSKLRGIFPRGEEPRKNSAGEIDVYADGVLVLNDLAPGTSSAFVEFEAGRTSPVVDVVDGSESTNENPISTVLVDFLASAPGDSLLSAWPTLVFIPSGDTLAVAVLADSRDSSAVPGMVDLAVVHAADTSLTLKASVNSTSEGHPLVAILSDSLAPLGSSIHATLSPDAYVIQFSDDSGNEQSFLVDLTDLADKALVGVVTLASAAGKNDAEIGLVMSLFDGQGNPIDAPVSTASETAAELPNRFDLLSAYPNPFNPSTTIRYALGQRSNVRIDVFDALGRRVSALVNADQAAGRYDATWNARNDAGTEMPSGTYIVRMRAGAFTESLTVALLR